LQIYSASRGNKTKEVLAAVQPYL